MSLDQLARRFLPGAIYERFKGSPVAKRLAKGSFWSLVNSFIVKAATLGQAIVLARLLGVSGFGEWGIVLSTVSTVGVFASFGLSTVAAKHVAEWRKTDPVRLSRLLGLLLIFAICAGLVFCLGLILLGEQISQKLLAAPQLATPVMLVGLIVFFNALNGLLRGVMAGFEQFQATAVIDSISTLLGVVTTIFLAYKYAVLGAVVGLVIASGLASTGFGYAVFFELGKNHMRIEFKKCANELKTLLSFSVPMTLAAMMAVPMYWVAYAVLVQQPDGYREMGGYQAGNQWLTVVMFLPAQLMAAYLPVMSSLLKTEPEKVEKLHRHALFVIGGVASLAALPLAVASPWIMSLYGSEFVAFYVVMLLLVIKAVFEASNLILQQTIVAVGRAWLLLLSNGTFCLLMLAGIFVLIPKYHALGLAITLLVAQTAHFLVQYFLTKVAVKNYRKIYKHNAIKPIYL